MCYTGSLYWRVTDLCGISQALVAPSASPLPEDPLLFVTCLTALAFRASMMVLEESQLL